MILSIWSADAGRRAQTEDIRLTLQLKEATVTEAIGCIKEQSPYLFFINATNLDRKVTLSVKNETIEIVCKKLFTPLKIS